MILAFDSYYFDNKAKTVCLGFDSWTDKEPLNIYVEITENIADYEPGSFYKRELPCIISLLKRIDINEIELIIVDSFVLLDDHGKLGLGGRLFEKLNKKIPIIGVAKSGFHSNNLNTKKILRGNSKKPLFVSSVGIELNIAYENIKSMHGDFRMPTLLQILDTKTKENCG
ncbi:endonuclease V [Tenacibaculum finnmarkense genomovar ulcerans]|uniref:endonuclease V n=1 Tax=Tenacibaculum finnmarkense TaxID=2781243 RepID=UPI001E5C3A60|nr:endonuclease V [Tenacibaculum finnmarkense]MCD8455243.1 endonuclease V [Tenacibaculum finnmarkense genomovar ulcerans]